MATSDVKVTEGSGKNVATNSISEDAETKQLQRVALNNSAGTEIFTAAVPAQVTGANGTFPASQSGTWTVQPGNTANTTAWKVDASSVAVPITDNSGSLTVDAPVGTPVFVRLSDGSTAIATLPTKSTGIVKTRTSIWSATTLTAAAGDTTSSTIDVSAGYGAFVNATLTNGGTGPTIAAQVQVQVANDSGGTLWTNYGGPLVGSTTNSAVTYFSVEIPIAVAAVRLIAGSNTGQNVTVNADISNITTV